MVVRCPAGDGRAFRCFNRALTVGCLDALAARRGRAGARLLLVGVSVMRHIWYAMGQDDVREPRAPCGETHERTSHRIVLPAAS